MTDGETGTVDDATSPPAVSDIEVPQPVTPPTLSGPPTTPQQRLYFYDADEWERFILEWATGLRPRYEQVKRLGGAGDRGVDVAGFKTDLGFEGAWDCYQGKHYVEQLRPSDAYPEILKLFLGVVAGAYTLPDTYAFLAPRGCGSTLDRLLSRPTELRAKFLQELDKPDGIAAGLTNHVRAAVKARAAATDFAMFKSVQLLDALETHRGTPYHLVRFGGPMPPRPPATPLPPDVTAAETRYVAQLVEVYTEQGPDQPVDAATVAGHPDFGEHFRRQRVSFFSAEALRLHARDSVPNGTFEALQQDIHDGVIETAEADHPSGLERLQSVIDAATKVQLDGHAVLLSVSRVADRKGICHQLANDDHLTWVKPAHD